MGFCGCNTPLCTHYTVHSKEGLSVIPLHLLLFSNESPSRMPGQESNRGPALRSGKTANKIAPHPILFKKIIKRYDPQEHIIVIIPAFNGQLHCKKRLAIFPSPAGLSQTKFALVGNSLINPGQGGLGSVTSRLGTGKPLTFFRVYTS
jgi:hypothetical protein